MTPSTQGSGPNRDHSLVHLLFDRENPASPSVGMRPPLVWSSIGAFFSALLALGVSFGAFNSALTVLALCLAIIPGWPVFLGLTNRGVSRVVMLLTLAAALPAAYFGTLTTTMFVAVGAIFLSFVGEMLRRDGRIHLIEHISASAAGAMLMITASFWVHVGGAWERSSNTGANPGVVVGLTIAITIAVTALFHGFDTDKANWLGTLNAVIVGGVAAYLLGGPFWVGLLIGVIVGLFYAVVRRSLDAFERPLSWVQGVTKSLVPHCSLGVIGYILTVILL